MCGIPGCGKSTYAKKLIELHPDWIYVSRDEVRYEYVSDQKHYFDHEADVYKEFCNRIDMHLLNGKTVIADATHLTINSRKKLLSNLSAKGFKIIIIVMNTSFETCMKRNAQRIGITRVPDKTMYAMKNRFKIPNQYIENFDKLVMVKGE
jgi:predicted kinase